MSHLVGMQRDRSGPDNFHTHTRAMWFEYKISLDSSSYLPEAARGTYYPPSAFVQSELGFGLDVNDDGCGPGCRCNSLRPTAKPAKVKKAKRMSGKQWQAVLKSVVPIN